MGFWPFPKRDILFCICSFSTLHMYLVEDVQKFYFMSCNFYLRAVGLHRTNKGKKSSFWGSGYPPFPVQLKREVCKILKFPEYYPDITIFIVSSLAKMTHRHF